METLSQCFAIEKIGQLIYMKLNQNDYRAQIIDRASTRKVYHTKFFFYHKTSIALLRLRVKLFRKSFEVR